MRGSRGTDSAGESMMEGVKDCIGLRGVGQCPAVGRSLQRQLEGRRGCTGFQLQPSKWKFGLD